MFSKVPSMLMDLVHCHVAPVTPPSGSDRLAVNAASTTGVIDDNLTVPAWSGTVITAAVVVSIALLPLP